MSMKIKTFVIISIFVGITLSHGQDQEKSSTTATTATTEVKYQVEMSGLPETDSAEKLKSAFTDLKGFKAVSATKQKEGNNWLVAITTEPGADKLTKEGLEYLLKKNNSNYTIVKWTGIEKPKTTTPAAKPKPNTYVASMSGVN